jgi:hypothetical protein
MTPKNLPIPLALIVSLLAGWFLVALAAPPPTGLASGEAIAAALQPCGAQNTLTLPVNVGPNGAAEPGCAPAARFRAR